MLANADFASDLAPLIVQLAAGTITPAQFATSVAALLNQWNVQISTGALSGQVTDLVAQVQQLLTGFNAIGFKGVVDTVTDLPSSAAVGDAYITADTGHGYAYVAGRWVDIGVIRGASGAGLLTGQGAPSAAVGNAGDVYLDLAAGDFYGPKTASNGWGAAIQQAAMTALLQQSVAAQQAAAASAAAAAQAKAQTGLDRAATDADASATAADRVQTGKDVVSAGASAAAAVGAVASALAFPAPIADDGPLYYGLSGDAAGQLATWLTATGAFDFAALGLSGQAILAALVKALFAGLLTLPAAGPADDGPFAASIVSDAAGQMVVWLTRLGALDFAALGPSGQAIVTALAMAAISGALTLATPGVADDGPYGYGIVSDSAGQWLAWLDMTGAPQVAGSSSSVSVRGGISYSDASTTSSHIHFTPVASSADAGGRFPEVKQLKSGLLSTSMLVSRAPLEILLYIGQSQAGSGPTAAVELRALYPYYCYAIGPGSTLANNDAAGGAAYSSSAATDLVALQDASVGNLPATAMLFSLTQLHADMCVDDPGYVAATAQQNGQSLDYFLPGAGQFNYENAIALVTAIKRVAAANYNRQVVVRTIVLNQGENGGGSMTWPDAYNAWVLAIISGVMAATGQTLRPKIILTVTSNADNNNLGVTGEQIAVSRVQADTVLGDPTYCYPTNYADNLHVTALGKQMQGDSTADIKRRLDSGLGYTAVQPDPANPPTISGNVITVPFIGPGPLSWDASWVPSMPHYGFSYTDTSSSPPTIQSVAIAGPAVMITLSAAPTAAAGARTVGYANQINNPAPGQSGATAKAGIWTTQLGNLMVDTGISSPAYRRGLTNPTPYAVPSTIRHYAVPFALSF